MPKPVRSSSPSRPWNSADHTRKSESEYLDESKPKRTIREIDTFTSQLVILDFIDNEMPHLRSVTDVKIALVLLRKTLGWGRQSEEIGATELALRAGVDKDVLKDRISLLCAKLGVERQEQTGETKSGNTIRLRTRYHWPINERVRKLLDKTVGTGVGAIRPPRRGESNPQGGASFPPTQSSTSESYSLESDKRASEKTKGIAQTTELPPAGPSPSSKPENQTLPGIPEAKSKPDASKKNPDQETSSGEYEEFQSTAEDVESISAVLKARGVKVPSEVILNQMLRLAAELNINAVGLARFIAFKCETRSPEIAGFFLKSIPEDMPHWAHKHGAQYILNRRGGSHKRAPSCESGGTLGVVETDNIKSGFLAHRDDRHQQLMNTPVLLADAIVILNSEVRERKATVSPRFLWLMGRTVNEITPAELIGLAIAWRTCRRCGDGGIVGSPLKGTLNFCDCRIGQQERLDRGDSHIGFEIERVNATLKSRLVQACRELKHDFTGDAIEQNDTTVAEQSDLIEICPGVGVDICCNEQDLKRALQYLGDNRGVRVERLKKSAHKPSPLQKKPITWEDMDRIAAEHRLKQAPALREPSSAESFDNHSNSMAANFRR